MAPRLVHRKTGHATAMDALARRTREGDRPCRCYRRPHPEGLPRPSKARRAGAVQTLGQVRGAFRAPAGTSRAPAICKVQQLAGPFSLAPSHPCASSQRSLQGAALGTALFQPCPRPAPAPKYRRPTEPMY